jgi:hypothetical protein
VKAKRKVQELGSTVPSKRQRSGEQPAVATPAAEQLHLAADSMENFIIAQPLNTHKFPVLQSGSQPAVALHTAEQSNPECSPPPLLQATPVERPAQPHEVKPQPSPELQLAVALSTAEQQYSDRQQAADSAALQPLQLAAVPAAMQQESPESGKLKTNMTNTPVQQPSEPESSLQPEPAQAGHQPQTINPSLSYRSVIVIGSTAYRVKHWGKYHRVKVIQTRGKEVFVSFMMCQRGKAKGWGTDSFGDRWFDYSRVQKIG